MAEAIISLLLEKVAGFVEDEILNAATAKEEVQKLEAKLKAIQPIARDAHNKQLLSKEVKDWVWRLNEVAYDALDVIEFYRIKSCRPADPTDSLQSKVLKETLKAVTTFPKKIRLHHDIATKIKEINERLNVIYEEKNQYELVPILGKSSTLGENLRVLKVDRETISSIVETKIIGREKDEEMVIKWLSEESNPHMAIVGMAGVGKTTLAQKIFHNHSVQGCFDKRMWVCVAELPKLSDLLRQILQEVKGKGSCSNQSTSANTIHTEIKALLKNKKFLLVLDDVWDCEWWDRLRSTLSQDCASGSKVLITTRKMQVANAMGLAHCYKLECLNEKQSWHLLLNNALRSGENEEQLAAVEHVGRDIARKCGGLPLALSVVGSLLRQKERRKSKWQNVLDSSIWHWEGPEENNSPVFAAIALSYMSIPYQLKQCLTYCCMYPKDFMMKKNDLVRLWVAEGFILKEESKEIEDTAEAYLDTLVGCNLIQVARYFHDEYKLHDIVHDFALHLREKEYVSMGRLKKNELVSHPARYISSVGEGCCYEALRRQNKLRGLMCHRVDNYLSAYSFDVFRWLRVLDLRGGKFSKLPESIGDLILLKYINLSMTRNLFELPESITKLLELQTLDLRDSDISRLPNKISALAALRHLDIARTWNLQYVPREIGKLTGLQTLPRFMVGSGRISEGMGSNLGELGELNNLKGHLTIEHLERVDNLEEVDRAQLKLKGKLLSLGLCCDSNCTRESTIEFNKDVIEKVEQVYERMQPPAGIEEICIGGYPGMKFPTWMSSSTYYSCLQKITISNCAFLESLPKLGLMPNLVSLFIIDCNKVKVLDFTSDSVGEKITFPKLKELTLRGMESLEEWQFDAETENMSCLRQLNIWECPKLKVIPFISTLEDLKIEDVVEWEGWSMAKERDMPCLKYMNIWGCSKLKLLPNCPRLERMSIKSCNQLVELPRLSPVLVTATVEKCPLVSYTWNNIDAYEARALKFLHVVGCPHLEFLLQRLQCGNLETLEIEDFPNLTSVPAVTGGLKRLRLKHLPQLESLPMAFLDSMKALELEELELGDTLVGSQQVEELIARVEVTRLRRLKLSGFHDQLGLGAEWFKSKIRDMVQLKTLVVEDCPKLVSSIADVLKEHTLPNLRFLRLASLASHRSSWGPPGGSEHLSCELVIDSVEMIDKLEGLMVQLSSKVWSLAVSLLNGVDSLLLSSIADVLKQHTLPNLRFLRLASLASHRRSWRRPDGSEHLSCVLDIDSVEMIDKLEGLMAHLSSKVRGLAVTLLPGVDSLPEWIQQLHQLEYMKVYESPQLTHLPHSLNKLHRLDTLLLEDLPELVELPAEIIDLPHPHELRIMKCPKLKLSCVPGLSTSLLKDLPELVELPAEIKDLPHFHELHIMKCPELSCVPDERC